MNNYILDRWVIGKTKYYRLKSTEEINEEKEAKKKSEVQNTKGVKFSNKNFFRGK